MHKRTTVPCVLLDIGASISARPERMAVGVTSSRKRRTVSGGRGLMARSRDLMLARRR
jgi:hypothetical protein